MTETIEMSAVAQVQVPFPENEALPTLAHEMLSGGPEADADLQALAEQVDEAYAEAGLEEALGRKVEFKLLGSGDGLGFPKEVH